MKKYLFSLLLLTAIAFGAMAQTDFVSYKGQGKLITNTGETYTGLVFYALSRPRRVTVVLEDKTEKVFNYDDTKEFNIGDRQYYTIRVKILGNPNTFAQLLNPESSGFIKLYRNEQQPTIVTNKDFTITTSYFIGIKDQEYAMAAGDIKLMPFNKKMSEIVKDCPALATKILEKQDGYKLGMISNDLMRMTVFQKIAKEFDECK